MECPDRRGTFGMLKSETMEMLERLKRWNPLDWNGFRIKSGRCLTYGSCASVSEVHEWDMLISVLYRPLERSAIVRSGQNPSQTRISHHSHASSPGSSKFSGTCWSAFSYFAWNAMTVDILGRSGRFSISHFLNVQISEPSGL